MKGAFLSPSLLWAIFALAAALAFGQANQQNAPSGTEVVIPEGTRIHAALLFFDAARARRGDPVAHQYFELLGTRPGDPVQLQVLEDVRSQTTQTVLIPKKATLFGRVVKLKLPDSPASHSDYAEVSIWVTGAEWKDGHAHLAARISEFIPGPSSATTSERAITGRDAIRLVGGLLRVNEPYFVPYGSAFYLEHLPLQKAAEEGNPEAQFELGLRHYRGEGVPQDYAQAVDWYRRAANQGFSSAQTNLAVMYAQGQGVQQDYAASYFWFSVASAANPETNKRGLQLLESRMTAEQIADGKRRAEQWLKQHPPSY